MQKPIIHLLVTDLDNTLYDWVTFFAYALYEMVSEAADILEVSQETLLDDMRRVHQRYGNSEYPLALIETDSALKKYRGLGPPEITCLLNKAFQKFNWARRQSLALYPGVSKTLKQLHDQGVLIVGHTEATSVNALFRLRKLGIAPYFTRLYAQASEREDLIDLIWEKHVGESGPNVAHLHHGERKPNPQILVKICCDMHVSPAHALYVGDSIVSDVGMAKEVGVWAAWAEYGTRFDLAAWDKLVRITHWTPQDVDRVKLARDRYGRSLPDAVLHSEYSEILQHFSFTAPGCNERNCDGQGKTRPCSRDRGPLQIPESERGHVGGA
jgi:phosphoglycolate phosphatase